MTDRVRVLEYRSKPGEKAEMHSHPNYLVYDLGSGYKIQLTFPDGKVKTIEGKVGTVSWQDAVTHALENVGTIDAHACNFSISPGNFIETKPQRIEKQGITFLNSPICPDLLRSYPCFAYRVEKVMKQRQQEILVPWDYRSFFLRAAAV
jgi:hypothetical protein